MAQDFQRLEIITSTGDPVSATNPLPTSQTTGGAAISTANPLPVAPVVAGAVVAAGNPLPVIAKANSGVDIGDVDVTSIAAGENHLGEVGGKLVRVSATFARPNDANAYGIGDVVSNSTVTTVLMEFANFARVNGGSGYITGALLSTDKKSIVPVIRVHLFNASDPTVAVDNAQHKELFADAAKRLGYFDLPALETATDAGNSDVSRAILTTQDLLIPFVAGAGRSIYALLETRTAFTPAANENFTLTLFGDLN